MIGRLLQQMSLPQLPPALRVKYFMRSRDRNSNQVRVTPELRHTIEFRRLNFMDADYGVTRKGRCDFLPQCHHLL